GIEQRRDDRDARAPLRWRGADGAREARGSRAVRGDAQRERSRPVAGQHLEREARGVARAVAEDGEEADAEAPAMRAGSLVRRERDEEARKDRFEVHADPVVAHLDARRAERHVDDARGLAPLPTRLGRRIDAVQDELDDRTERMRKLTPDLLLEDAE